MVAMIYDDESTENLGNLVHIMPKYFNVPDENILKFKITKELRKRIDSGEVQVEQDGQQCLKFARKCVQFGRENFTKSSEAR